MQRWKMKYATQKALSLLPLRVGLGLNHFLSTKFGHLRDPRFWSIDNCLGMVWLLEHLGFPVEGRSFVEIGTGWDGSAAMLLLALGATSVDSYDLFRHLDERLLGLALAKFRDLEPFSKKPFPFHPDARAIASRCDTSRIDRSAFHYHAPHDARHTGVASDSVDCYYSLAVLEHVSSDVIPRLLDESLRILKPGGVCFHYVQPTMHACWLDPASTGVDYLRYSDRSWNLLFNNGIAHENRLRARQYVEMIERAGFKVLGSWTTIDEKGLHKLQAGFQVSPMFSGFSDVELATDYIWVIGQKPLAG